uniref:Uncharacterized protein n=1 Tax=Rhizophora mucronata TaxID=61149 RepID=A0A2P2M757_RHIMU
MPKKDKNHSQPALTTINWASSLCLCPSNSTLSPTNIMPQSAFKLRLMNSL